MVHDLGDFVRAEVTRAETDFASSRSRALSVVAVAGGLVALVTGLLSVAAGSQEDILPRGARWLVGVAMLAFVGAAVCALKINLPSDVTAADDDALADLVQNKWTAGGWDKEVASLLVDYLKSLRAANGSAAKWLVAAIGLEIAGIAFTALAGVVIVANLAG